jgi:transaldolase
MIKLNELKIKIFADGANKPDMLEAAKNPLIAGFTTNPTLMRKAGVSNYQAFALDILQAIKDRPISFEVFSDDFQEMYQQALKIASWGDNVYVKIPVTNSKGESSCELIQQLASLGVKQNITAILTLEQTQAVVEALKKGPSAFVSIFAGRIADTGRDPRDLMQAAMSILSPYPQLELLWASTREVLNIFQANALGCHIITATPEIINKLANIGKDLTELSLETVQIFRQDALKAGFSLELPTKIEV